MIKLLIVDDEYIIRNGIFTVGDWQSNGIKVIGLAENGEKALSIIEKEMPDIVLTDIVMPKMNGLELLKVINVQYPAIKTIVLSGYEEFQFAKSAIEQKVSGYLLKPAQIEIIMEVILKLKKEIETEREKLSADEILQEKLIKSLPLLRDQYLNNMLNLSANQIQNPSLQFEYLGISLEPEYISVIVMEYDQKITDMKNDTIESYYTKNLEVIEVCKEVISQEYKCCVFNDTKGRIVAVLNYNPLQNIKDNLQYMMGRARRIQFELEGKFENNNLSVGISGFKKSIREISEAYKEGISALEYKFFMGYNSIIYIGDMKDMSKENFELTKQLEHELLTSIRTGNLTKTDDLLNIFFTQFKNERKIDPTLIYDETLFLLNNLFHMIKERDLSDKIRNWDAHIKIIKDLRLKESGTILELEKHVKGAVSSIIDCITEDRTLRNKSLVDNAKQYICDHMDKDISLITVADAVHVSPNYLSFLFKDEGNITFKEYVIQVKMEKAMELMENTHYNLNQIAQSLGYSDGRYFSQIYKKYLGKTLHNY